MIEGLYYMI